MKYSTIPTAQSLIEHCKAKGLKNIVISPGSRNAPLTISFTENPYFNCFSIVDERCAAFFALGMARQLNRPVAVVCTSGSALLNYYPAVAEAYYSEVPLVVISADRPSYKIDIGDGQTIRQKDVFKNHIGESANLRQDVSHATNTINKYDPGLFQHKDVKELQQEVQAYNDKQLNRAINCAIHENLPVHINIPLEEPLYNVQKGTCLKPNIELFEEDEVGRLSQDMLRHWKHAKKKMVLVGGNPPHVIESEVLEKLANDPSVLVFTETTSNLHHPNFFNSIDSILAPIELKEDREAYFKNLRPDVLVTMGGLIVSKKIKAFLRDYAPKHHWHVGNTRANNTFFCLEGHFKVPPNNFLSFLYASDDTTDSDYFTFWNKLKKNYEAKRKSYLGKIPFSDFLVFDRILKEIPSNYQLHLANSSTIRYTQLFDLDASLKVFCNRGTSGIDGSTSTAIGAAVHEDAPTLLITGDLSFFYDSNALWNNYIRNDFRIILINNNGGGIFRILPGKEDTSNFERFFETKHDLNASSICKMYNIEYVLSSDENSLAKELSDFYKASNRPKLLEVQTPRVKNNKILTDYFHFIS
ncbi:2-succinyl-5-enolpyruvyl-6-hydroxy-3-cyclohexene-1-carboxylate synthase [Maribacter thermophilus]|uniref:2-succinyl-5-enolpyruvyl-6-hydroxy-3- cyclohexene-1-carboxylate synthase n=1 Tax=Maribacter thermophilus TaxID=1197874 RepID=UPI00064158DA|nr:2-succinyl-5-enolpyruvyl-6-hydroxy-3-cyclohexene-1-carboxylate synthase [Maribacter thermophilus]